MSELILAPLMALVLTAALTPLARRYAVSKGLIDAPGPRRSHREPVPRGGGLAVSLALLAVLVWLDLPDGYQPALFASLALITLIGWADDLKPIRVRGRLAGQAAVALGVLLILGPVDAVEAGGRAFQATWLWTFLALVAMVWVTNLVNFMDGSDGLAATQAAFSGSLAAWAFAAAGEHGLAAFALALAGAGLGFLAWNRPPASVFLGDAGSLAVGWALACLALAGTLTGAISVWLAAIIIGPFVVDATATLIDRGIRRQRWYTPHRDHAYQRLIRRGWSHRRVLLCYAAVNVVIIVPACGLVIRYPALDLAIAGLIAAALLAGWALVRFSATAEPEQE